MKSIDPSTFKNMTGAEKTAALKELYAEAKPELDELVGKLQLVNKFCRDLGAAEDLTWATTVVSLAEACDLELDTENGMAVAALLAAFQMRLA